MKIALLGCGNIGRALAKAVDEGGVPNTELSYVYDIDAGRAHSLQSELENKPEVLNSPQELMEADVSLVVESASQEAVRENLLPLLSAGKHVLVMSTGALLDEELLSKARDVAEKQGCQIHVPSGAICGLDGVKSASAGRIEEVILTTRKPPEALQVEDKALEEPLVLYEGPAREAVKRFPKNVNVSASLSLAGVGADETRVRVIADPSLKRNVHEVVVRGEFGELRCVVENTPSPQNPKTSYLAVLSAIQTLREISSWIRVGT